MRPISGSSKRSFAFVMVIWLDLPVDLPCTLTSGTPFASISTVISICGTPEVLVACHQGGTFRASYHWLSIARSLLNTSINTPGWFSAYVVNVCPFFVGIAVLRLMAIVITPPAVNPWTKGSHQEANGPALGMNSFQGDQRLGQLHQKQLLYQD